MHLPSGGRDVSQLGNLAHQDLVAHEALLDARWNVAVPADLDRRGGGHRVPAVVDGDQHQVALELPQIRVEELVDIKRKEIAKADGRVLVANLNHAHRMVEDVALEGVIERRTVVCVEHLPGHVSAVVRVLAAFKADLRAVVDLGDAAGGEQESDAHLQDFARQVAIPVSDAIQDFGRDAPVQVVVVQQGHQPVGVGVGRFPVQDATRLVGLQPRAGQVGHGPVPHECTLDRPAQGKVEQRVEVVLLLERADLLRVEVQYLAEQRHLGVPRAYQRLEQVPEHRLDVLDGVHTDAVDARLLDPVQDVLHEIVGHLRQVVVQVRQPGQRSLHLAAGCGSLKCSGPQALAWIVLVSRRVITRVVDHHVEHHLQAGGVEGLHQLGQVRATALGQVGPGRVQVRVDALEVYGPVAVIAGAAIQIHDVDVDRCQPNRSDAEGLEVGDLLHQPGKVTAVKVLRIGRLGWLVVTGVAVEKAVGDNEVNDVVLGDHAIAPDFWLPGFSLFCSEAGLPADLSLPVLRECRILSTSLLNAPGPIFAASAGRSCFGGVSFHSYQGPVVYYT